MSKFLLLILGGIGMGLCPAPFNQWWWAWIALVPLWQSVRTDRLPHAFGRGVVWGSIYHGFALFWLTGVHPMTWLGVPWVTSLIIALGVWMIVVAWGALLVGLWAMALSRLASYPTWGRLIIGTALFCALEKGWSFSPLFWSALGYTQSPGNLVILQLGRISGQQTVTALIVATNGLLAELLICWQWQLLAGIVALALSTIGYGVTTLLMPLSGEQQPLTVGIIQGNISNPVKFSALGTTLSVQHYREGYVKLARSGAELIVTPEGALPFAPNSLYSSFIDLLQKYQVPLWLGGIGDTPFPLKTTNSLLLWSDNALPLARYDKVRLVPIGEYIPLPWLFGKFIQRLSPLEGAFLPGDPAQEIVTPWGKFILGICYESAYPDHFRRQARAGGELIITASNNSHYAAAMPAQHHAQDVARAIETDRYAVRATNTGYSGIVDPRGNTLWLSDINTYQTHQGVISLRSTQTPYVKYGDWLTIGLLLVSAGIVIVQRQKT